MPELPDGSTVVFDREACIGAGMCVTYAPATFGQDEDVKSVLLDPPWDDLDRIRTAVDACPMGALTLVPKEQGE